MPSFRYILVLLLLFFVPLVAFWVLGGIFDKAWKNEVEE